MEYWLKKSYFDASEVYADGETKESRRQKLASIVNSYISAAPPSSCFHHALALKLRS